MLCSQKKHEFQSTSRIKIEADILKRCTAKLKGKQLKTDIFDEVQARVRKSFTVGQCLSFFNTNIIVT